MPGKCSKKTKVILVYRHIGIYYCSLEPLWSLVNYQGQQGRLVYVRTAVAATCIKIKSQVAQRNEDLIACSMLLSVISFGIVLTIQPCLK